VSGDKKAEIQKFLKEFNRVWDGTVIERLNTKNDNTLLKLGITPIQRANEVRKLTYKNYFNGPSADRSGRSGDIWEFGTRVKKEEIYIKLKIYQIQGNNRAKCISFHIAEKVIKYPFY
jgi:hypothetical protein